MSESAAKPPRTIGLILAADIMALVVCIVYTITDSSPWPALVVAVLAFASANLMWQRARRTGAMHPLVGFAWALGLSSLAWAIGLVIANAT